MPENRAFQNNAPERVVSLQPSVTVTLRDLGSLDRLVACTKYCVDVCPEVLETGCIVVEDSWSAQAEQIMAAKLKCAGSGDSSGNVCGDEGLATD